MRPDCVTVDLHADLLWRTAETGKDPWAPCPGEMLDLPRMALGGPSLQCFTLYTPGEYTGGQATAYAEKLLGIWQELVARGEGRLGWVRSAEDLAEVRPSGLHGILTMEGASPLRGELELLDRFHDAGVRSLGLTHNPRNEAADGCMIPAEQRRGLTPFGRALVRRCVELGVLLDVAHLAPEGFADLMDVVAGLADPAPVVSTHTGCAALTPHPRNLDDEQLRALADTGGLAGVTLYPPHIRSADRPDTLANALDHLEHLVEVCGIDHVGVGADLDGFDPPGLPGRADTPHCYALLAEGLAERGRSESDVRKILGENALRVFSAVLR